ncbi:hypothetical protein EV363DRAFT_1315604 [Boletus edulis]|nr:hypothetical protein EV363DRAFT_1315604 [Boletus edulis]
MDTQSLTGHAGAGDLKISPVVNPDIVPLAAAYELSPEQATFFKAQTGVDDDDNLRCHMLKVQEKAYDIFPYPCIRSFTFLQLGMSTLPEYAHILNLGQQRVDGILLDMGCCFGVDSRKAVADGFPLKNVVTTDLREEFFDMGHALFNTTPATYPINFVPGDVFHPNMLQVVPPFDKPPVTEKPELSTLTSLNPLAGRCAVIYAANFFHLFSEENQLQLARSLAGLLSPEPGSMICGEHAGGLQKGILHRQFTGREYDMLIHCPESWNAIWDGGVFAKGKVRVDARFDQVERIGLAYNRLRWSVVRL